MKRSPLKTLASVLLIFNGIGALYGGWSLITRPDGSGIDLSLHWLEHTPFQDYQLPGIILFMSNGLFSCVALTALVLNRRKYFHFISAQGLILIGWIIIQILMIQTIYFLHLVMGVTGLAFILIGVALSRTQKTI